MGELCTEAHEARAGFVPVEGVVPISGGSRKRGSRLRSEHAGVWADPDPFLFTSDLLRGAWRRSQGCGIEISTEGPR